MKRILWGLLIVLIGSGAAGADEHKERWIVPRGEVEQEMRERFEERCAMVSFNESASLEEVRDALNNEPLAVKGFRHGSQLYAGGYTLRQGESLDEAVLNYRRDHEVFLERRMQLEGEMMAAEMNDAVRDAIEEHRVDSERMKADYKERGVRVVGMEVCGRMKDIYAFTERNAQLRVTALRADR